MKALMTLGLAAALAVSVAAQAPAPSAELKVGDVAPDFTLPASDGKTYKLSSFRGKQAVVLAWFPKAFTRGCTIECKSLAEGSAKLKMYDATYFMASVDPLEGEQGNKAFAASMKADFPLLSDVSKETAKAYGVLMPQGFSNRWTFYIDKSGKIAHIDKDVAKRLETSADDMAAQLAAMKVPMNH
jgi:thioredoxin-dependent peroxiredoxin